jgi:hypothetical protein
MKKTVLPNVEAVKPPTVSHVQKLVSLSSTSKLHIFTHGGNNTWTGFDSRVEGWALFDNQLAGALGLAVLVGSLAGVGSRVGKVDAPDEEIAAGKYDVFAAGSKLVSVLSPD